MLHSSSLSLFLSISLRNGTNGTNTGKPNGCLNLRCPRGAGQAGTAGTAILISTTWDSRSKAALDAFPSPPTRLQALEYSLSRNLPAAQFCGTRLPAHSSLSPHFRLTPPARPLAQNCPFPAACFTSRANACGAAARVESRSGAVGKGGRTCSRADKNRLSNNLSNSTVFR